MEPAGPWWRGNNTVRRSSSPARTGHASSAAPALPYGARSTGFPKPCTERQLSPNPEGAGPEIAGKAPPPTARPRAGESGPRAVSAAVIGERRGAETTPSGSGFGLHHISPDRHRAMERPCHARTGRPPTAGPSPDGRPEGRRAGRPPASAFASAPSDRRTSPAAVEPPGGHSRGGPGGRAGPGTRWAEPAGAPDLPPRGARRGLPPRIAGSSPRGGRGPPLPSPRGGRGVPGVSVGGPGPRPARPYGCRPPRCAAAPWPRRCAAAAWPPLCTAAAGHGGAPRARPDRIRPSPGVPDPAAREGTPQVPPGGRVRGARACVTALGRVTEPRLARSAGCPGGTPGTAGARGRRRPPRCGRRPRPSAAGRPRIPAAGPGGRQRLRPLSAAARNTSRGFSSSPSEIVSRRKNSASVQSMTTRAFRLNVGIRSRW